MIRIGVICPSEIAFRRFMPALQKCEDISFTGLAVSAREERFGNDSVADHEWEEIRQQEIGKAKKFTELYGGKIYNSYAEIAAAADIDAIYIPLPPALHYKWAKFALEHGKHVLVEKPATVSAMHSHELVKTANENGLALHENYMFVFHDQLDAIEKIIHSDEIGDVRLYRISFGFPRRALCDFRYNRALGGGALIDAGGYTIRYADRLLGPDSRLVYAQSNYVDEFEVDLYGSAAMVNHAGVTAQIAFGMDNDYKCELEVWGSKGCLKTGRVLTAPAGFVPTAAIIKNNESRTIELPVDDAFYKSIRHFVNCISNKEIREQTYHSIVRQSDLVDEFKELAARSK